MKIEARLLTCDFEEDTLTLQLTKGFWNAGYEIMAGDAIVETDSIGLRATPLQDGKQGKQV